MYVSVVPIDCQYQLTCLANAAPRPLLECTKTLEEKLVSDEWARMRIGGRDLLSTELNADSNLAAAARHENVLTWRYAEVGRRGVVVFDVEQ